MAVHGVGIDFSIGAIHFAHKSCNGHEALRESRFLFIQFTGRLTDIMRCPHSLDSFQEICFERDFPDIFAALDFCLQFLCGNKNILGGFC